MIAAFAADICLQGLLSQGARANLKVLHVVEVREVKAYALIKLILLLWQCLCLVTVEYFN